MEASFMTISRGCCLVVGRSLLSNMLHYMPNKASDAGRTATTIHDVASGDVSIRGRAASLPTPYFDGLIIDIMAHGVMDEKHARDYYAARLFDLHGSEMAFNDGQ